MGSTEAVAWALQREIDPDLPVILRIRWAGEPESKSRARVVTPRKGGRTYAYTPAKTRLAEDRIIVLARQAGLRGPPDGKHSFGILAKFFCAGWQRRDVDNMLKLVADALTGIVWVDDSQVSEVSAVVRRGVGTKDARSHLLIYQTDQPLHPTAPKGVCQTCGGPVSKAHYLRCQSCSRGGRMNGAPLPLPEGDS